MQRPEAEHCVSPNHSPDHSIGRSDGRCVQRAGTYVYRLGSFPGPFCLEAFQTMPGHLVACPSNAAENRIFLSCINDVSKSALHLQMSPNADIQPSPLQGKGEGVGREMILAQSWRDLIAESPGRNPQLIYAHEHVSSRVSQPRYQPIPTE